MIPAGSPIGLAKEWFRAHAIGEPDPVSYGSTSSVRGGLAASDCARHHPLHLEEQQVPGTFRSARCASTGGNLATPFLPHLPSQIFSRDLKGILDVLDLGRLGCSTPAEHHIKTAGPIPHLMTSQVLRRKSDEPGLLASVHGVRSPSERGGPASLDLNEHQRVRLLRDQIEFATGRSVVTSKNPIPFPAQIPLSFRLSDLSE